MPLPGEGQFGTGIEQALRHHGQDQIPLWATPGRDQSIQAEFADRGEDGFDMAVRQSFLGGEQSLGRDEGLVLEQAAEGVDFWLGRMGEVGEGALAGFVVLAPAFAEEDGGGELR